MWKERLLPVLIAFTELHLLIQYTQTECQLLITYACF